MSLWSLSRDSVVRGAWFLVCPVHLRSRAADRLTQLGLSVLEVRAGGVAFRCPRAALGSLRHIQRKLAQLAA